MYSIIIFGRCQTRVPSFLDIGAVPNTHILNKAHPWTHTHTHAWSVAIFLPSFMQRNSRHPFSSPFSLLIHQNLRKKAIEQQF